MTAAPARPAPPSADRHLASGGSASGAGSSGERATTATAAPRAVLALALVLALGIRLWGLGWALPWQFHPDEGHYTWKAMDLIGQGTLNPKYFRNPSLFTSVLLGEYTLLGYRHPKQDPDAATATGLLRPPSGVAYIGRLTSTLLGVATVAAVARIGWTLVGPWTGVLAALFLGLAFIHVRDSHYATNDVPATLLLTLSVGVSLSLLRHPTLARYALAGVLGGLATSTKYNAGLFVVPLVVAHALVVWRGISPSPTVGRGGRGVRALLPLVLAGVASLLAYLAGTPYTVLDFPKFLADFRTQMSFVDEGWEGQAAVAPGLAYLFALGTGAGWVMLGLTVVGVALLARRAPVVALVLAAFPVAYLLFMLGNNLFFVRFALPVVPFLCLFAAYAVVSIAQMVAHASRRPSLAGAVGAILALAALAQPTVDSLRHAVLIGREDTRALAARWALETVRPGEKLLVEEYTIRDRRDRAYNGPAWVLDTDELDVNAVPRANPTAPLLGTHRYVMVSSFQYERFGRGAGRAERQGALYAALDRDWRLVAEFSPGVGNTPIPFDLEDLYTPFWDLARYERPGPTIRVYERP